MLVDDFVNLKLDNGRYLVKSKLGEGGMGTVYFGQDTRLDAEVVVKVPHPAMMSQSAFRDRFQREIQSLVRLSHPHIVKIIDVGEHNEIPFAVMQYLGGGSLVEVSRSSPSITQLGDWLLPIAKALDYIHRKKYIHRDVKPANILFDESGNAFLGDFGIAKVAEETDKKERRKKLTQNGIAMGTPEYMAPELCDGRAIDHRVDQYALGITVYEFLAGRCPLVGPTPLATILMHKTDQPQPLYSINPEITKEVSAVVHKALSKDPADRFENCLAFAQALFGLQIKGTPANPASSNTGTSSTNHDETLIRGSSDLLVEIKDDEIKDDEISDDEISDEAGSDVSNRGFNESPTEIKDEVFDPSLLVEVTDADEEEIDRKIESVDETDLGRKSNSGGRDGDGDDARTGEGTSQNRDSNIQENRNEHEGESDLLIDGNQIDLCDYPPLPSTQKPAKVAEAAHPPATPPPIKPKSSGNSSERKRLGVPANSLSAARRTIPPLNSPAQLRKDPCPACNHSLQVPDHSIGKTIACPYCQRKLLVHNFGLREITGK